MLMQKRIFIQYFSQCSKCVNKCYYVFVKIFGETSSTRFYVTRKRKMCFGNMIAQSQKKKKNFFANLVHKKDYGELTNK